MKAAVTLSLGVLLLLLGCVTPSTVNLDYLPGQAAPAPESPVIVAVLPFEDTTVNGQEDHRWVGLASLYREKLLSPLSISQLVTRGVRKEMEAYGYQICSDEIYTIQIGRQDIKTLLKKIPYTQVDYLIGGAVSHFFVHQKVRFVADVEIEAFIVRPGDGETIWSKKIGHREERIPFSPDTFSPSSQTVLNKLLDKTIKDLLRNSDFRLYLAKNKR
ncbi:MAG: hypothetical protein HY892_14070 [Deltaproteobacteria bacterium]|nr:hypothetical protein [Deltaproteobacteria bacterium]